MDMSLSKLQEMVMEGRPGMLQSMGLQRVGHDWATELTELLYLLSIPIYLFETAQFLISYISGD